MPRQDPAARPAESNVLEELRTLQRRVADRIEELAPFAREFDELRAQAARLGLAAESAPARPSKQPSAKPQRRRRSTTNRRKAGGESRAEQVERLVNQQPGITIPKLGEVLGVDSTGLYRVVKTLQDNGRVRKEGRELQPVAGAKDTSPELVEA